MFPQFVFLPFTSWHERSFLNFVTGYNILLLALLEFCNLYCLPILLIFPCYVTFRAILLLYQQQTGNGMPFFVSAYFTVFKSILY